MYAYYVFVMVTNTTRMYTGMRICACCVLDQVVLTEILGHNHVLSVL